MSLLARLRQRLARAPWIYWALVAAFAVTAAVAVSRATSEIGAARDAWGDSRRVVVAVSDLSPGDHLAGAVQVTERPAPAVPASALEGLDGIDASAVVRHAVAEGEVIVELDVAAPGGPQALTPAGWLAVPIAEAVPSGAGAGDRVQVAAGGVVLAGEGVVVGTGDGVSLVAVPRGVAAQVAQAAASAEAVLLLVP